MRDTLQLRQEATTLKVPTRYQRVRLNLQSAPRCWLITGVAGFIGSNLLESLLRLGQSVKGVDNFSTGKRENLEQIRAAVSRDQWAQFRMLEGDIRDLPLCRSLCADVDVVLHQAALGSAALSIEDPIATNENNVSGFLNMLVAARDNRVRRFVYAASNAMRGEHAPAPRMEESFERPLSPYAVSKYADELYSEVFSRCYGMENIGLRYFNVFGPRQNPEGPDAAVIPTWIAAMLHGRPAFIDGDGTDPQDFCFIEDAVQANLLAATTTNPAAVHQIYNVAVGEATTPKELFEMLRRRLERNRSRLRVYKPVYRAVRTADDRHSCVDIGHIRRLLEFVPTHSLEDGLDEVLRWYEERLAPPSSHTKRQRPVSGPPFDGMETGIPY